MRYAMSGFIYIYSVELNRLGVAREGNLLEERFGEPIPLDPQVWETCGSVHSCSSFPSQAAPNLQLKPLFQVPRTWN